MLSIRNLQIGYKISGNRNVLIYKDINFTASRGELISLIGMNGIGKSTLLRTLARLGKLMSGEIVLDNRHLQEYSRNEFARQVGFVSTDTVDIHNLSVFDLVSLGRYPYTNFMGHLTNHDNEVILSAIKEVGLTGFENKNINEISDGERQRTMIARTLAQDTNLIILDEPTAFLDISNRFEIIRYLKKLAYTKGKTVIFSSHDLGIAMGMADKMWLMMKNGTDEGAPEDLVLAHRFEQLFNNEKLYFQKSTGEVKIRETKNFRVSVSGTGDNYYWTTKALNRIGFEICSEKENMHVSVLSKNNTTIWEFENSGKKSTFDSVYSLTLHLKEIINKHN